MKRIIVGLSGASGVGMGLHLVRTLRDAGCETYLVMTEAAQQTWEYEMPGTPLSELFSLASRVYSADDMAAAISSGSFVTDGMIVLPCSMKTLAGIVSGCLKEGRRVVLCPREMPLGRVHLRNLLSASELGCVIVPPMLTFYNDPKTLDDQIRHVVGKALLPFGIQTPGFVPWHE